MIRSTVVAGAAAVAVLFAVHARAAGETAREVTLTGEVVDVMCYVDHGARGDTHADCAARCIQSGGPIGLLQKDGTLYMLIGDHAPLDAETWSKLAAKTVTVKGMPAQKAGVHMLAHTTLAAQ